MVHWTHAFQVFLATSATLLKAASLQKLNVTLDPNPSNVGFYIYVPDQLPPQPPILVNPHWCHGDAPSAFAGTKFADLASQYGFIVIYPDSPNIADKCWDVSSRDTLSHNGGGDSQGIVSMVKWTVDNLGGDATRVFVTGVSSGAMMTNVLVGAYPDVFAGASAFAGVPFGCYGANIPANASDIAYWNTDCAEGRIQHSPAEWASIVNAANPSHSSGWRPKVQVFHGTADKVLNYTNFVEEIKQWTGVFGLKQTPTLTVQNTPLANWTKYVYGTGGWFEAYSALDVTHDIPVQVDTAVDWFDLRCSGDSCFRWGQGGPST